ncbi:uncharacterized protein [Coffea arabica]|uniref:Uncharacterized protein isoform X2 n=1 Tax=Coffea arabica TaxID=13443 RepID=A0ABM4U1L9_COFAR
MDGNLLGGKSSYFQYFQLDSPGFLPFNTHNSITARLVLALGAQAKLESVPGAAEYALPFSTLEDARVSICTTGH